MPSQTDQQLMIQEHDAKLAAQSMTPMDLLQMAVQKGVDIDQLGKLMELQERWQANQARTAFNEAMARFKKNPPELNKNKTAKFDSRGSEVKYSYCTLDNATNVLIPALCEVGISHRWEIAQNGQEIAVTCVLTHEHGHSEGTTAKASPDTSGAKNAIQAIGSAVTYLQRYTLLAACGIAVQGTDDDGASAGAPQGGWPKMPDGWLAERLDWIDNCSDADLFKTFKDAYKQAFDAGAKPAVDAIVAANKKRKGI